MIIEAASKVPGDIGSQPHPPSMPDPGGDGFGTEHKALLIEAEVEAACRTGSSRFTVEAASVLCTEYVFVALC